MLAPIFCSDIFLLLLRASQASICSINMKLSASRISLQGEMLGISHFVLEKIITFSTQNFGQFILTFGQILVKIW